MRDGMHAAAAVLRPAGRPGVIVVVVAATLLLAVGPWGLSNAAAAPTLDDQVHAIARDLMCPVCAGQTVAESGAQLAEQMRAEIRQRLQAGQTREEIIAYFVGQFGEGTLATPRPRGIGVILWLSLPLAIIVGAVMLRRFVRSHLSTRPEATPVPPPPTPEEAEQIAEALRRLDDTR